MDENDINSKYFEIPKDNNALRQDIKSNKKKYMDHLFSFFTKIESQNVLPEKINVFKFKETNLEIVIKKSSYVPNLKNLLDYYSNIEEYEKCSKINSLILYIESINKD